MEKVKKITIDGIEYNLLTDMDIGKIKQMARLEAMVSDIKSGKIKTISSDCYKAIKDKKYGHNRGV